PVMATPPLRKGQLMPTLGIPFALFEPAPTEASDYAGTATCFVALSTCAGDAHSSAGLNLCGTLGSRFLAKTSTFMATYIYGNVQRAARQTGPVERVLPQPAPGC